MSLTMFETTIIKNNEQNVSTVQTMGDGVLVYSTNNNELKFLNVDTFKTSVVIRTSKTNQALLFCFSC